MTSSAPDIYAEELSKRGHGLPLWVPEPTEFGEVLIGDVGYVKRGAFYRLFNVTRPADDPINKEAGVPDGFQVLTYTRRSHHRIKDYVHGAICSRTVQSSHAAGGVSSDIANTGLHYKFQCDRDRGAALVMKNAGVLEEVHASGPFETYFRRHHTHWMDYASKEGLTLSLEDLLFVRGWIKTTAWGVAAFMGSNSVRELSFQANGGSFVNADFSLGASKRVVSSVEGRTGPPGTKILRVTETGEKVEDEIPNEKFNQCVFIHALKCKRRAFFGKRLQAAATPLLRVPELNVDDRESGISPVVPHMRFFDEDFVIEEPAAPSSQSNTALDDILDHILENSDANLAIASDFAVRKLSSSQSVVKGTSKVVAVSPPPIEGGAMAPAEPFSFKLKDVMPEIEVDEDGVGSLVLDRVELDEEPSEVHGVVTTLPGYVFGRRLARQQHSFASVHLAHRTNTDRLSAVKIMHKQSIIQSGLETHIKKGLKALRAATHPFIVHASGWYQDHTNLYIMTDFVSGIEMHQLILRLARLTEPMVLFYTSEMVSAINYIHGVNVIHGSINPSNILLDTSGHIKLCGFTFAHHDNAAATLSGHTDILVKEYTAPEVLLSGRTTKSADWFSLGIVMYEMLAGHVPKQPVESAKIHNHEQWSQLVGELISQLTLQDPDARHAKASNIHSHDWFAAVDWLQVQNRALDPPYQPYHSEDREWACPVTEPTPEEMKLPSHAAKFSNFVYRPPHMRAYSHAHAPRHPLSSFVTPEQTFMPEVLTAPSLRRLSLVLAEELDVEATFVEPPPGSGRATLEHISEHESPSLWTEAFWKASLVAYC